MADPSVGFDWASAADDAAAVPAGFDWESASDDAPEVSTGENAAGLGIVDAAQGIGSKLASGVVNFAEAANPVGMIDSAQQTVRGAVNRLRDPASFKVPAPNELARVAADAVGSATPAGMINSAQKAVNFLRDQPPQSGEPQNQGAFEIPNVVAKPLDAYLDATEASEQEFYSRIPEDRKTLARDPALPDPTWRETDLYKATAGAAFDAARGAAESIKPDRYVAAEQSFSRDLEAAKKLPAMEQVTQIANTLKNHPAVALGIFAESGAPMAGAILTGRAVQVGGRSAVLAQARQSGLSDDLAEAAAEAWAKTRGQQLATGIIAGQNTSLSVMSSTDEVAEAFQAIPDAERQRLSPKYREIRQYASEEQATQLVLSDIKAATAATAALTSGLSQLLTAGLEARLGAARVAGAAAPTKLQAAGSAVGGAAREAGQEIIESGGERYAQNVGMQEAIPSQSLSEGVLADATIGAMMGGATGGVASGVRAVSDLRSGEPAAPAEPTPVQWGDQTIQPGQRPGSTPPPDAGTPVDPGSPPPAEAGPAPLEEQFPPDAEDDEVLAAFERLRDQDELGPAVNEAAASPLNDRPEPTEAQKAAGNQKMGHLRVQGLDISIENPAGSRRNPDWEPLQDHYGYIRGTTGADKEHVDVFLGSDPKAPTDTAYVVDQHKADGTFDERKVVLRARDIDHARAIYRRNYPADFTGLKSITAVPTAELKAQLAVAPSQPFADQQLPPLPAFTDGRLTNPAATEQLKRLDSAAPSLAVKQAVRGGPVPPGAQQQVERVLATMDAAKTDMAAQGAGNVDPVDVAVALAEETGVRVDQLDAKDLADAGLVTRAMEIDEVAVDAAATEHADNDGAYMASIRRIIDGPQTRADQDAAATGGGQALPAEQAGPAGAGIPGQPSAAEGQLGGQVNEPDAAGLAGGADGQPGADARGSGSGTRVRQVPAAGVPGSAQGSVGRAAAPAPVGGGKPVDAGALTAEPAKGTDAAAWDASTPAQRREMLKSAGYTDGDQARGLSGTEWAQLADPVRKAMGAKMAPAAEVPPSASTTVDRRRKPASKPPSFRKTTDLVDDIKALAANGELESPAALQIMEALEKRLGESGMDKLNADLDAIEDAPKAKPASLSNQSAPTAAPAQPDRRKDSETRQRVDQMSQAEMRRALLVDALTGLGNRRAYDEAERLPVQASIDVDSLKWVNDTMGHDSGDKLLAAVGQAMLDEPNAYHVSGDEFVLEAQDTAAAEAAMERVNARLAAAIIAGDRADGTRVTIKGIGVSYGTGTTLKAAEGQLQANKQERERAGRRAARGQQPPNAVAEVRDGEDQTGAGAEEVGQNEQGKPAKINTVQTRTDDAGNVEMFDLGEEAPALNTRAGVLSELEGVLGKDVVRSLQHKGLLSIVETMAPVRGPDGTLRPVRGYHLRGKVTLVAGNLKPGLAYGTFIHELGGHGGIQAVSDPVLLEKINADIDALVAAGDEIAVQAHKYATGLYKGTDKFNNERLAYVVQYAADARGQGKTLSDGIKRLLMKLAAAVRRWLRDKAGMDLRFNANDLLQLAEVIVREQAEVIVREQAAVPRRRSATGGQMAYDLAGQTDTPAFKRWFGRSVVTDNGKPMDEGGKPMVVYHGTTAEFSAFRPGGNNEHISGRATWFATSPDEIPAAHNIGGYMDKFKEGTRVLPVYLNVSNPLIVNDENRKAIRKKYGSEFPLLIPRDIAYSLMDDGYDGFFYFPPADVAPSGRVFRESKLTEIAVFGPEQIKSATGNRGTFDPNDPRIQYDLADPETDDALSAPPALRKPVSALKTAANGAVGMGRDLIGMLSFKFVQNVRDIGTPAFRQIADRALAYEQNAGRTEATVSDFLHRRYEFRGRYEAKLSDALRPLMKRTLSLNPTSAVSLRVSDADNKKLWDALTGGTMPADPALKKVIESLRKLQDEMLDYQRRAGLNIGEVKNYFPRIYDRDLIARNPALFQAMLTKNGIAPDAAVEITNRIIDNDGQLEQGNNRANRMTAQNWSETRVGDVQGGQVQSSHQKARTLNLPDAVLSPWLEKDVTAVMYRYINLATRRAEYARAYGDDERVLNKLIRRGLTELSEMDKPDKPTAAEVLETVYGFADALQGVYRPIHSRTWRGLNEFLVNAEVMMHLAYSAFSSVSEFWTPLLSGEVSSASLAKGISEAIKTSVVDTYAWADEMVRGKDTGRMTEMRRAATEFGLMSNEALRSAYDSAFHGTTPRITSAFMRITMLEQLTRAQKVLAFSAFLSEQKRIAERLAKGKKSATLTNIMKDYGLDEGALALWGGKGEPPPALDLEMKRAAQRFTMRAITTPNETNRPEIMQRPALRLIFLFQNFAAAFANTMLKRVLQNYARNVRLLTSGDGDIETLGALARPIVGAILMTTFAIWSQILREALKYDEDELPPWAMAEKDFIEKVETGIDRAGFLGPIGGRLFQMHSPYKTQAESFEEHMASQLGPLASDVAKGYNIFVRNKDTKQNAERGAKYLVTRTPFLNMLPEDAEVREEIEKELADYLH